MRLLLGLLSSAVVASSTCAQCDHGECTLGFCVCDDGWAGLDCNQPQCHSCSNGKCTGPNQCECEAGWTGASCHDAVCDTCHHEGGECIKPGQCQCKNGWDGSDCSRPHCQLPCENDGICIAPNVCQCPLGFTGAQCRSLVAEKRSAQCSYTPHLMTTFTGSTVSHRRHGTDCMLKLIETRHFMIDFVIENGVELVNIEYRRNVLSIDQHLNIKEADTNSKGFVMRVDSVENVLIMLGSTSVVVTSTHGHLSVYLKTLGSPDQSGLCAEPSLTFDSLDEWSKSSDACHLPFSQPSDTDSSQVHSVCRHLLKLGNFGDCIARLNIQESAMNRCEAYIAQCNDETVSCSCAFLTEISHQCTQANIRVDQWRTESFCPVNCPANLQWAENLDLCTSTCANQRFAANDLTGQAETQCEANFMSGCSCPVGKLLREDGHCVNKVACGCEMHGQIYGNGEVIESNCQSCLCQHHHWQCQATPCSRSCSARGAGHIDTFDDVAMSHRTHGTYQLIRDSIGMIQLNAEFGPCELNEQATCFHRADLLIKGLVSREIRMGPGHIVTVNAQSTSLPLITSDLVIYEVDSKIVLETNVHLRVEFEPAIGVTIMAEQTWRNHLSGLCGNYNGKRADDYMTSLGFVGQKQADFISSWVIPGQGSFVPSLQSTTSSVDHCSKKSFTKCKVLLGLAKCSSVITTELSISRCQEDVCNSVSAKTEQAVLCSYLSHYINQCSTLLGADLYPDWHKEFNCVPVCGKNEVYTEKYYPLRELCRTLTQTSTKSSSGCACQSGYGRDTSGACIPKTQCPCHDEKGVIVMSAGEGDYRDGSYCKCTSGQIKCQPSENQENEISQALARSVRGFNKKQCRKGMKMLPINSVKICGQATAVGAVDPDAMRCGCVSGVFDENKSKCVSSEDNCSCDQRIKPKSTLCREWRCQRGIWTERAKPCPTECAIYGTDHLRTFDGRTFSFGGVCETILATNQCEANSTAPVVRISAVNQMCDSSPDLVCSKRLTIVHEHGTYVVFGATEETGRRVINKEGVPPLYGVRHVGLYIIIQASPEITVMWDASLQIHIIAEQSAKGKLCGMCGNNNGQLDDDDQLRDGSNALSGIELGNGWKASIDAQCQTTDDFCLARDQRKSSFAHENCKVLKSSTFAECAEAVDVVPYHAACLKSACSCSRGGDCECLCASIAAYARQCALAGYAVRWRNENLCPLMCEDREAKPGGTGCMWHYDHCRPACEERCEAEICVHSQNTMCMEGCFPTCPEGTLYSERDNDCIPKPICYERQKTKPAVTEPAEAEPVFDSVPVKEIWPAGKRIIFI